MGLGIQFRTKEETQGTEGKGYFAGIQHESTEMVKWLLGTYRIFNSRKTTSSSSVLFSCSWCAINSSRLGFWEGGGERRMLEKTVGERRASLFFLVSFFHLKSRSEFQLTPNSNHFLSFSLQRENKMAPAGAVKRVNKEFVFRRGEACVVASARKGLQGSSVVRDKTSLHTSSTLELSDGRGNKESRPFHSRRQLQ